MKKYFKEVLHLYIIIIVLQLVSAFAGSVIYTMPGYYVDNYNKGIDFLIKVIILVVISFMIYILSALANNIVGCFRRRKFENSLKRDFFNAILNRDYQTFHKRDVAEYISIQSNDLNELLQNYLGPIEGIIRCAVLLIVYSIFLIIYVDIKLVLLIILLSLIALFAPKITNRWVASKNETYFKQLEKYNAKVTTLFKGYDILDKYSKKVFRDKHEEKLKNTVQLQFKSKIASNIALTINGGVCEGIRVIVFIYSAYLLYTNNLTLGAFIITLTYSTMFLDPLHEFNLNIGRIKSVSSIKYKVEEFLKTDEYDTVEINEIDGDLKLENVGISFDSFSMNSTSCIFKAGEKYLISGDNGTGKSTLLKIVMQFIKTYDGDVLINNKSIKNHLVTNAFAYVPQHGYVIESDDYYNNITIYDTYDVSNLDKFEHYFPASVINKLKSKDSLQNISGGERQVISLLRALCSDKKVLILDEPFSAMSKETYLKCFDAVLQTDKTVLFVMHNEIEDTSVFDNIVYM